IKNQHTYRLKNYQGGTALDLAANDYKHSVVGFRPHYGSNQAWMFQQDDDHDGWFIKCSRTGEYLGIEGNIRNGTRVIAVPSPFKWDVRDSDVESAEGIRILAHGTNFSLDLSYGNSESHTRIQLWKSWPGPNQIW
ncbi:ricin B-like lectin, partial [Suillus decipiens]